MSPGGVVIAGAGLAGVNTARALRGVDYPGPITVLGDERHLPYDRPPLSKQVLAGTMQPAEATLLDVGEAERMDIEVRPGCAVRGTDPEERKVTLANGTVLSYDALVLATGSRPRRLPFGAGLGGVHYLRSLDEATELAGQLQPGRELVVIGAGFIGLEVAATARAAGMAVTVLESATEPLTRVLGGQAGRLVTELHRARGVDLRFGVQVTDVRGHGSVEAVVCADGTRFDADVVVIGVGAVPNVEWLAGSGIKVDNGAVCDDGGLTSAPGVFAVGDVSRWRNARTGSRDRVEQWQTTVEQARIVAANMVHDLGRADRQPATWSSVPYFWSDQYEHKIQFCGSTGPVSHTRGTTKGPVVAFAPAANGPVSGILTIDHPAALARGRRLVASGASWDEATTWLDTLT